MIQSMIQSYQQGKILFIQGRGYEIVREMQEQGSQTINYIAKQSGNPHEQVVIKQYNSIKMDEIEVLNKIQKEQNENKSKNKHIIKILGIQACQQQKEQNNFLIVLEQGKNNTQHLINTNTSLNLVQKFKLFRQMTKGVKELHDLGYFHRDLKPDNFVYFEIENKTYKVKLIDFGLVRNVKNDFGRLRTQQVGTWNYMSPEVMIGQGGNYDKTADIWSLGIILYKMLTKEDFLKGKSQKELISQMLALTQEQISMKIDQTNCMGQSEKDIIKCMLQIQSQKRCNLEIILKQIDQYLRAIEEQEQKELQELENKKQSLIDQLKDIQSTIKNNIQYIMEKQQIINSINLQDKKKQELLIYINNEIKKYEEILLTNAQRQKSIQTKEMLKEYEYELTKEYQQYINGQKVIIEKITQEQSELEQQVKDKEQEQKIRIQLEQKLKMELEQKFKMEFEQKLKMEQEQKLKMEQEQKLKIELEQKLKMEQEQKLKMEQEQKLKKEQEQEQEQYQLQLKIVKQQLNQQSPQMQQIQAQITFYQGKEIQIQGEEKIQDMIKYHQLIIQDIQTVEFQEKIIQQYESLQKQIATYQSYNNKLEEIQQYQNRLKTQIEEAKKCIQQIDKEYLDIHQYQIEELNDKLIDYQEKYQYFSTNQKYSNQITQIINQIGQAFGSLDNLKQLISQRTQVAYQQYTHMYLQIQQSFKSFKKQHSQLHQQIYNDEQIELKNQERIKTLEITKQQLDQFIIQMYQLKDQVKNLIKREYCNNEKTQNLINTKLTNIDQNIKEQQEQFVKFTELNQLDSCENINSQIKQLEEFQRKLKDVEVNEIECINQLEKTIKRVGEEIKSEQENEILTLNNQLKTRFKEYTKALYSIKFHSESFVFNQQINQKKENLQKELEQEISILNEYSQIQCKNMQLFEYELRDISRKKGKLQQDIQERLKKFKQICHQKGQRLENIIKNVSQKQQEVNFCLINDNLIQNYEQLKMQEEQLSIELTSIKEKIYKQQLNPQQLNELKEYILKVFADIDELMKKIPENNEIEKFNHAFLQNLESYEKVYALINYIKQYHLTRYYERIKENANSSKKKQQSNIESDYQRQFQSKLNVGQEENTKKEKEAQDILFRYENVLFKNYYKMTIEAMEKDKEQIQKQTIELENYIKSKNLVKLRSKLKDQNKIKDFMNVKQYYKITEFTQMLFFKMLIH